MFELRQAPLRGEANFGWLDSRHTFSFGGYWDPAHMGFSVLRVINEDRVAGGAGFPRHPHRDMEIISYVLSGALEHKDSMGNGSVIRPGEVQYMSAGSGVTHSEFNASSDVTHFYQLWIVPDERGGEPRYAQTPIDEAARHNAFGLLAGGPRFAAPITLRQDAALLSAKVDAGARLERELDPARAYWLQVARGDGTVANPSGELVEVAAGDGLALDQSHHLDVRAQGELELLLFDLPSVRG